MKDLVVHKTNISHYRLVELSALADQAKPFYEWVERLSKKVTSSHKDLNDILMTVSQNTIKAILFTCYKEEIIRRPLLFDGIGRVYNHSKACFFFFAWMIRDAPQQRLAPLLARMKRSTGVNDLTAQVDTLSALFFEYRSVVKSFHWPVIREIIIDRLEGSRRSIKGHRLEANVRTALVTAIQNVYTIDKGYGLYEDVVIADKQIKIGNHTIDVSAEFISKDKGKNIRILMPIKTRETEGGGHSHIFSRDLIAAIRDIKEKEGNSVRIAAVIVAENWSLSEIENIKDRIDVVFHFDMSPNKFFGFDEDSQFSLNRLLQNMLLKTKLR